LDNESLPYYEYYEFEQVKQNFLKNWGKIRQEKSAIVIKNLQEGLGAIKEIKILGLESEFSNNFQKQNYLKNRVESNIMAFQQIPKVFLELLAKEYNADLIQ
jgi:hypothetical protein